MIDELVVKVPIGVIPGQDIYRSFLVAMVNEPLIPLLDSAEEMSSCAI
jgi:hypothetical protein